MLTEKQLRERLWVNRGTLLKLRKQGLPHIKIGRLVRFDFDDVMKWMKGNSESYQRWEQYRPDEPDRAEKAPDR